MNSAGRMTRAMIEVAHPDHRAKLDREAHGRFKKFGE